MAPINSLIGNPPAVMHAPEAPVDAISWRSMAVNWAGSMLFIGFCAPLLVWLTVYCIRTRRKKEKAKGKLGTATTVAQKATQPSIRGEDAVPVGVTSMQRSSLKHHGIETHDVLPLDAGLPTTNQDNKKIPKIIHLSRYLGWWSSGTSREEDYPADPRARKKGAGPYTKRDHFTRFLGWWTSSEQEGNAGYRRHSDPGPNTRANEKQRLAINNGSTEAAKSSSIQPLAAIVQRWQLGRHAKAHTSIGDLGRRRHSRGSQRVVTTKEENATEYASQDLHTGTTGVNARRGETSNHNGARARVKGEFMMDGPCSTDEISEHKTVRRRTVAIAEACGWANLSNELRRSVHTQALLPNNPDDVVPALEPLESADRTPARRLLPVERIASSPQSFDEAGPQVFSPKLRRVRSSPTLRTTYKGLDANSSIQTSFISQNRALSNSSSSTLISIPDQENGIGVGRTSDIVQRVSSSYANHLAGSNAPMWVNNVSQSSLTLSFDKTRRSTLDVLRIPVESDRRTLDEYEAESSVDAEICTRASSGSTFSSMEKQLFFMGSKNGKISSSQNMGSNSQSYSDIDCTSFIDGHRSFCTPGNTLPESSLKENNASTANGAIHLDSMTQVPHPFAVPALPSHRHNSTSPPEPIGNSELVVSKTRASKVETSNDKEGTSARKLTPFTDWRNSFIPKNTPRKSLPKDWQAMDRLSEAISLRSENDTPLKLHHGTICLKSQSTSLLSEGGLAKPIHSSHPSRSQTCIASPSSPNRHSMQVTPKPPFVAPIQDDQQTSASMLSKKQGSIEILPTPLSSTVKIAPHGIAVLTETQLSSGGSSVKQVLRNSSTTGKAKKGGIMRRAGCGKGESDDIGVTLAHDTEDGERAPSS